MYTRHSQFYNEYRLSEFILLSINWTLDVNHASSRYAPGIDAISNGNS